MPQRKSAKEELKKSKKRHILNLKRQKTIKAAIKTFKRALANKDVEASQKALNQLYRTFDKAASKKIIHANKVARKKSRFTSQLNKLISSPSQSKQ